LQTRRSDGSGRPGGGGPSRSSPAACREPARRRRPGDAAVNLGWRSFIAALGKKTGLAVPEADYPELATPSGAVSYLKANWDAAAG